MDRNVWVNWLLIQGALFFAGWAITHVLEWRNERRELGLPAGVFQFVEYAIAVLMISALIALAVAYTGYVLVFKKGSKNAEHK